MPITLSIAEKLLKAAKNKAISQNLKVSIAVVDSRGDLIVSCRMDGMPYFTPDLARGKAMVSANLNAPSGVMGEHSDNQFTRTLNQMNSGRLLFVQGGLPIVQDNQTIGAIGVAGATSQQDEDIAKAALAVL
jgi:glc operon protein GlcG